MEPEPRDDDSDDALKEMLGDLQALGRHPGYQRLMDALLGQYQELSDRLVRENEPVVIYRTQGSVRSVVDILEAKIDRPWGDCLRLRMIREIEIELAAREEQRLETV